MTASQDSVEITPLESVVVAVVPSSPDDAAAPSNPTRLLKIQCLEYCSSSTSSSMHTTPLSIIGVFLITKAVFVAALCIADRGVSRPLVRGS